MYYPRVQAFDRLRGRVESFGSCGAAAGMIARADESWPVWTAAESEEAILRPGLRPAVAVSDAERARLAQAGVNTLLAVRGGARTGVSPRTLAAGGSGAADWKLPVGAAPGAVRRREHRAGHALGAARAQRTGDLGARAAAGARLSSKRWPRRAPSPAHRAEETHFVICDERVNRPQTLAEGKFNLLFGFCHQQARRVRHLARDTSRRRQPRAPGVGEPLRDLASSASSGRSRPRYCAAEGPRPCYWRHPVCEVRAVFTARMRPL